MRHVRQLRRSCRGHRQCRQPRIGDYAIDEARDHDASSRHAARAVRLCSIVGLLRYVLGPLTFITPRKRSIPLTGDSSIGVRMGGGFRLRRFISVSASTLDIFHCFWMDALQNRAAVPHAKLLVSPVRLTWHEQKHRPRRHVV